MDEELKSLSMENDDVGFFLSQHLEQKPEERKNELCNVSVNDIYQEYCKYETESNSTPEDCLPKHSAFCRNLRARGFKFKRKHVKLGIFKRFLIGHAYYFNELDGNNVRPNKYREEILW
jgi:hypothetical protein